MKTKSFVFAILTVVGGMGIVALLSRPPAKPISVAPSRPPEAVESASTPVTPLPETIPAETMKQPAPLKPKQSPPIEARNTPTPPGINPAKEPLHDPEAREALALVGMDPEAEQYWLDAIFDTSLPGNEREDLMEDLNETGFADPKNLTEDDLPLIMNRLEVIDAVLPSADDFMTDHLLEAQKDLVNMYARLLPNR